MFTPGVQVKVGNANRTVTCTVGWWLVGQDGTVLVTSAGQCGLPGEGMPVRFDYMPADRHTWEKPDTRRVADVLGTTFKEPYNADNPDVALFRWIFEGNDDIPVSMMPGNRIKATAVPVGDAKKWAEDNKGQKVCWFSNTTDPAIVPGAIHCGQVFAGVDSRLAVTRADADALKPEQAGAPVFWQDAQGQDHPLGIATEDRQGHVVVDTLDRVLAKVRETSKMDFTLFVAPVNVGKR